MIGGKESIERSFLRPEAKVKVQMESISGKVMS